MLNKGFIGTFLRLLPKFIVGYGLYKAYSFLLAKVSLLLGHPILLPFWANSIIFSAFCGLVFFLWHKIFKKVCIFLALNLVVLALISYLGQKMGYSIFKNPDFMAIIFLTQISLELVYFIHRFRKNRFVKKSLEEIDSFGNGNTYIAGRLFEEYVVQMYRTLGYKDAISTTEMRKKGLLPGRIQDRGGSGEQGVDICLSTVDNNSIRRVIIQCKHSKNTIGNKAVQEIFGAMNLYEADLAMVITNNYYSDSALELAEQNGVILLNRDDLAALIDRAHMQQGFNDFHERQKEKPPMAA